MWSSHYAPQHGAEVAASIRSVRALSHWLSARKNADVECPHEMLDSLYGISVARLSCDIFEFS
jgi:hypothetical protein